MDSISSHYVGHSGELYAAARGQNRLDGLGDRLQSRFFVPHLRTSDHVLDFGCGNGSMARCLRENVASITGLEVNEHPRRLAESTGLQVYSRLSDIPAARRFDAIVSNHVLEHIPDVIGTLRTLRTLLDKRGRLIVMLPIEDFRERRNRHWKAGDVDRHLYTWTPLLFGNLLHEAGYKPQVLSIVTHAQSRKLHFLGEGVLQDMACLALSILKRKRQLLAIARPHVEWFPS
jgi:cyclopropane fatty-acyl-phospholipid synthase-like methyltransferase